AQQARPDDPWPRGKGHVVLALPESLEVEKSYHEPGGSFSPEFRSFGISFWITDPQGNILKTSDSIPMEQIRQRFIWQPGAVTPSIKTETGDYEATWALGSTAGISRLQLKPKLASGNKMMLAIRSVGPAG